ncbi:right-handed parallel beta-helix repeat-containing protein, partial [candidate division WOR-3 bacterium]|nr:right-handed parallel beta-helix repeat-containing protein [candidate division WOR-3 bacterium]
MRITERMLLLAFVGALTAVAYGVPIRVPEDYTSIQLAVTNASDGDTISVWGPPPGQPSNPPYHYYENVNYAFKSLVVASRCFLPNWQGCTPTWDSVVIDGGQSGPVVSMGGSDDAVLTGFTIQNGFNYSSGGGVNCGKGHILKNHIRNNYTASRGGGVFFGNWAGKCWIDDNLIENNTALMGGGGIEVEAKCCYIRRNVVMGNTTPNYGGGMRLLYYDPMQTGPLPNPDDSVTDNVVVANHLTGSDPKGGGILAWEWPRPARRNVVTDNDSNGVYVHAQYVGPLDLGDADDPGLNVLMRNGSYDLVDSSFGQNPTLVHAIGNYWGYLDTHTILGRILSYPSSNVLYDPVAASSQWFDVDLTPVSTCSTDVLVTSALRVTRSLTVVPGKKFVFYLDPDTSGIIPELNVSDSGTVLTSVGTASDTIKYVPQQTTNPNRLACWQGIRVHSSAHAQFEWSEIKGAYCGIDVGSPYGKVEVKNSRLDSCRFAGAYGHFGSLDVDSSDVSWNGVYGVRYETHSDPNLHCYVGYCTISSNGFAGVSLTGIGPLPYTNHYDRIEYNQIDGGDITLYGVEVSDTCCWPAIADNQVSGCAQAGMEIWTAPNSVDTQLRGFSHLLFVLNRAQVAQ